MVVVGHGFRHLYSNYKTTTKTYFFVVLQVDGVNQSLCWTTLITYVVVNMWTVRTFRCLLAHSLMIMIIASELQFITP